MTKITGPPRADSSSEVEFSGFSDNETPAARKPSKHAKKPRKTAATLEKDSEDEELENAVFGKKSSWIENLHRDPLAYDNGNYSALVDGATGKVVAARQWDKYADEEGDDGADDVDDANLFAFDNDGPAQRIDVVLDGEGRKKQQEKDKNPDGAAWCDSDDDRVNVSLASKNMLRKLRRFEGEDIISGREYAVRLREQYDRLHAEPKWAREAKMKAMEEKIAVENGERPAKRRRGSVGSDEDMDSDEEDDENVSALPLSDFLRDIRNIQPVGGGTRRNLRPETLDIQRSRDLADAHSAPVTTLQFHPKLPSILMSSSKSSLLRIHMIDPAAHPTPNPTVTTIQLARTPILRASFAGEDAGSIFMAGRRRYMHNWNLATGVVRKTTKISGNITKLEHRTFEDFRPSPCGRWVALLGSSRKGGGTVSILSAATMMWNAEARLDSRGGIADFAWWQDGEGVTILGRDGSVGEYDVRSRMFVTVWTDEGNIGGMVLSLGGSGGPKLLGRDKWLAIGDKSGFVHVYDRNSLFTKTEQIKGGEVVVTVANGGRPAPLRRLENIRTRITTLVFSPDGQMLVMASADSKDALRVVHMPSCTYYKNWPTQKTPLGRVTAVAVSREGVLVVGNDVGKVRVFEVRR